MYRQLVFEGIANRYQSFGPPVRIEILREPWAKQCDQAALVGLERWMGWHREILYFVQRESKRFNPPFA